MNKSVKVFCPATIANISCGFDVIGLAIEEPKDEIIIKKSSKKGVHINKIYGANLPKDPNLNVAGIVLKNFLYKLQNPELGIKVDIYKNIYPGSGIGSSAASAAGVVVGANILFENPFTSIELIKLAMEGERLASGSAHADNVAPAIIGGITLIRSYSPLDIISINVPKELWVTVLHPKIEIKTSEAREILKKKILMSNAIRQWGNVGAIIAGFYREDYSLISRSLEDFIVEPIRSILIPSFQELKIKCKEDGGALGGGISGSGPSVFMLSKGKERAKIVALRMDKIYSKLDINYKIYISPINKKGITWKLLN